MVTEFIVYKTNCILIQYWFHILFDNKIKCKKELTNKKRIKDINEIRTGRVTYYNYRKNLWSEFEKKE